MARIPMGNFGQAVARPGPTVGAPQGDTLARAMDNFAGAAVQISQDAAAQETRQQLQQADEAKAAALRAQTITALTGTKDKLADLHDEITQGVLDGTVPKEKATEVYAQRSAKVLDGVGADLPDAQRGVVLAELNGDAARLGNSVRKAVTQRDRQDVTSAITQNLEHLQRQYKTDPAKVTAQADALVDQLGPHSTLNPEQLSKLKQSWRENTQFTAGYEAVTAGRADRKALDRAEQVVAALPDIDPQKRAQLGDRIASYRLHLDQKDEIRAQRLAREAERRLKIAEASFQTFQGLADKGGALSPEYIDSALAATAGTPYQAGIRALAQQARETGGLAAQTVESQAATLQAIDRQIASGGRTPELDKRRQQVERVLSATRRDLEADPMSAALERGVITRLEPLNPAGGLPALVQTLSNRRAEAERVSVWAGRPVSPLTAQETDVVRQQLDSLPVRERAGAVAGLAQAMGPQLAQGFAHQLSPRDDALGAAFALAGEQTTAGRQTAELVLRGQAAKKDGTSTKGSKQPELQASRWSASVAEYIGDAYPPGVGDTVRNAAVLVAHGIAAEQGGELSSADLQRAARLAMGGDVVEHNGRRVPVPAGFDGDALDRRMRALTAADVGAEQVLAGGRVVPAAEFARLVGDAPLMAVGKGRYAPLIGGRPALLPNGQPVVIGVR